MSGPTRTLLKPDAWPAGHRAALAVFVDFDPEDLPWVTPSPLAQEAAAERLMSMLSDLDIVPTVVVDPEPEGSFRLSSNHEYDPAVHLSDADADLSTARSSCESRIGTSPKGVVLLTGVPSLPFEKQDFWFVDGSGAPFPERTAEGRTIVPYSPWWHDATWLGATNPAPPSAMLEHLSLSLASVRSRGELMSIFLTAQIAGHPGHVETIQRFLDETIAAGDVWITNGSGVAELVRNQESGN